MIQQMMKQMPYKRIFLSSLACAAPIFSLFAQQEPTSEELFTRAQILYHAGEYTESRFIYESALTKTEASEQRDVLIYNIGTNLLAEGQPQAALDLWASTDWTDSPPPWLTRRLNWNCAIAQIQKAQDIDISSLEGTMHQLRLLHTASQLLNRSHQAECIWQGALSSDPCRTSLALQEALQWMKKQRTNVESAFRMGWIIQAGASDLVGAILATTQRLEETPNAVNGECEKAIQQLTPYWNSLQRFPSIASSLHPALLRYKTACLSSNSALRREAQVALQESAQRLNYPYYPDKQSAQIRLLYAQGLAEEGNLLYAKRAAEQHRTLLTGSEEGKWAEKCAQLGQEAFAKAHFSLARLLWQTSCFWLDEQALFLDRPPALEETASTLLRRHLFTQFFTTHLVLAAQPLNEPEVKETLELLLRSMLTTVASFFSLAKDAQNASFDANQCSVIAWGRALPAMNQGETFLQSSLQFLQTKEPWNKEHQLAITQALEKAYPFWMASLAALHEKQAPQEQKVSSPAPVHTTLSSNKPLSLDQRKMLLQEMEADDHLKGPSPASTSKENYPW